MKNISQHITYKEATKSNTAIKYGIDNTPTNYELSKLKDVAENIFEPLRGRWGIPIAVTSFFRSKALNKKIGGASKSQHCKAEAIDMDADVFGGITNKQIFDFIKDNLEFDKLIWEFGDDNEPNWVHCSYVKGNNRKQVLVAYKETNIFRIKKTKYKYYE